MPSLDHARALIRDVPDFPQPGILFKDITPVLGDPKALQNVLDALEERLRDGRFDRIVAIESRGFVFGAALALRWQVPLALARKFGKLPGRTVREVYSLEYGEDTLEMHADALEPGQAIVIVDDLLATGGTAQATVSLAESLGAKVVGCAFVVELDFLKGREKLGNYDVFSLLRYQK